MDPSDSGYQAEQAVIAVGSGEIAGAATTPHNRAPLPTERHTDFIFAVIGERYGFAGTTLVVLLYGVLLGGYYHILRLTGELLRR